MLLFDVANIYEKERNFYYSFFVITCVFYTHLVKSILVGTYGSKVSID